MIKRDWQKNIYEDKVTNGKLDLAKKFSSNIVKIWRKEGYLVAQ